MLLTLLAVGVLWAQRGGSSSGPGVGALIGMIACPLIIALVVSIVLIAGFWKIFEKAGKPGWAAIVPIYNQIVLLEIIDKPLWWFVLLCIPCVNIVFSILVFLELANKFGKSGGFAAGLILLPVVFVPMLGFGSARYQGGSSAGRRRAVDEEDEDEAPRPKPRRRDDEDDEDRIRKPRRRDDD
jgi:hypothetical protein